MVAKEPPEIAEAGVDRLADLRGGVGCNWLVCLGVWLSLASDAVSGKILGRHLAQLASGIPWQPCGRGGVRWDLVLVSVAAWRSGRPKWTGQAVARDRRDDRATR